MAYSSLFKPEYILGINKTFILNEINSFLGRCSFKLFFRFIIFVWFYGIYAVINIACKENLFYEIIYESLVTSFLIYLLRIALLDFSIIKSIQNKTSFLKTENQIKKEVQKFKQFFVFNFSFEFLLQKIKLKYNNEDRAKII